MGRGDMISRDPDDFPGPIVQRGEANDAVERRCRTCWRLVGERHALDCVTAPTVVQPPSKSSHSINPATNPKGTTDGD